MKKYALLCSLLYSILSGCQKEEVYVYQIDDQAKTFVETFFAEASKQGITLEKENLMVEFTREATEEYCGHCIKPKNNRKGQRTVQLNMTRECWENEPTQNKEALVFHELGHCLLNRGHRDDLFPSGAPASIMTTVLDGPYQPCEYILSEDPEEIRKCNRTVRRAYYLEELFDKNTVTLPEWANP